MKHQRQIRLSRRKKIVDTNFQHKPFPDSTDRIRDILGVEFIANSIQFMSDVEGIKVYGYASIPTFNAATSVNQHFFVNNRIIKDKVFATAVKAAYNNIIPHNRAAKIVLYMVIDNKFVDVNVHPAKAEVRFIDPRKIKSIVIDASNGIMSMSALNFMMLKYVI